LDFFNVNVEHVISLSLSFAATSHTDSLDGIPFEQARHSPIAMTLVGDAGGASVVHPLIK
jgi:hypothetical protein